MVRRSSRSTIRKLASSSKLWELLADTDLLVTSSRPSGLARPGLDWESLHTRRPHLCQVRDDVGHPGADAGSPGTT